MASGIEENSVISINKTKIKMKRYSELTTEEKLALNQEDFVNSVHIEAIHRGARPPLKLDDVLNQQAFNGFQIDPDSVPFYEIVLRKSYGFQETGLCFKTEEEALNACKGAMGILDERYGADKRPRVVVGDFVIQARRVSLTKTKWFQVNLEEYINENEPFDEVCEECTSDLSNLRQIKYNNDVLKLKRQQYLDLAKGDEAIASAFWAKTEGGPFPSA